MRFRFLLPLLGLLWVPALAAADIPPPRGYVEKCTIGRQCHKGEVGDLCKAWHGDTQACSRKHKDDGFEFRCQTSGASVWEEVWCGPKKAKSAPVAKPDKPAKPEKSAKPTKPTKPAPPPEPAPAPAPVPAP